MMITISFSIVFVIIFVIFSQRTLSSDEYEEASVRTKIRSEQYAIKTFQNQYGGDTYDCVDIYKQFSLTHYLLKNHKIQMRPSSKPKHMFIDDLSSKWKKTRMRSTNTNKHLDIILEGLKSTCPRGTIPIRRSSLTQQPSSDLNQNASSNLKIFSGIKTKNRPNFFYRGATAKMSLHNPSVTNDQMSGVVISVQSGGDSAFLNKVEAGWMVNPELYGDTKTRLYTKWTADEEYRTGCYNIKCPGFILINSQIPIDLAFNETTTGPDMVQIDLQIFQDKATGNWWLVYGQKDAYIGYWPKEIVPNLTNGAERVEMGGIISAASAKSKPPMGSGFKFFKKFRTFYNCAFFAQIQFLDDTYLHFHGDNTFIDLISDKCYKTTDNSYIDYKLRIFDFVFGYSFLYGGQGGDETKCE